LALIDSLGALIKGNLIEMIDVPATMSRRGRTRVVIAAVGTLIRRFKCRNPMNGRERRCLLDIKGLNKKEEGNLFTTFVLIIGLFSGSVAYHCPVI